MVGRDRGDRAVADRLEEGRAILVAAQRRVHLHVRIECADGLLGEAEVVRRRLRRRPDAGSLRAAKMLDRFAGRQVHEVHRLACVAGEVDVTRHHQALTQGRPAADAELCSHRPGVRVTAARQGLLFAVDGDHTAGDGVVLQRAPHHAGVGDRPAVVGEGRRARVGESPHLGQLRSGLAARDRGHEPDRDVRLLGGAGAQAAQDLGVVDHGIRVGNREDRAVAAGRRGRRAGGDRLLVLTAGRPKMDVWVDERRREHTARRVDHAVPVRVEVAAELRDHAVIDANVEQGVDTLQRIEHARSANDEALPPDRACEHHATSTAVSTATGPEVSRS